MGEGVSRRAPLGPFFDELPGAGARGALRASLPLLLQPTNDNSLHRRQEAVEARIRGFEFAIVGGDAPVLMEQPPESERYAQDGRSDTNNDSADHQDIECVLGHGADCRT